MSLASRPARVTFPQAGATEAAPPPARLAPRPAEPDAPPLGASVLGLGIGPRLAVAAGALACLWSAIALGLS